MERRRAQGLPETIIVGPYIRERGRSELRALSLSLPIYYPMKIDWAFQTGRSGQRIPSLKTGRGVHIDFFP